MTSVLYLGLLLLALGVAIAADGARARRRPAAPVAGWARAEGRVVAWHTEPPVRIFGPVPDVPARAVLEYAYTVDGRPYTQRVAAPVGAEAHSRGLRRRLGSLGAGEPLTVWYDPAHPASATVVPDGHAHPLAPILLVGGGLAALVAYFR